MPKRNKWGFYPIDGEKLVSVTTVINNVIEKNLDYWRGKIGNEKANEIVKASQTLGIGTHRNFYDYFFGDKGVVESLSYSQRLQKVGKWFGDNLLLISGEQIVYNLELGVAGTLDLFSRQLKDSGKFLVLDYKTSGDEHPFEEVLQVSTYAYMAIHLFKPSLVADAKVEGKNWWDLVDGGIIYLGKEDSFKPLIKIWKGCDDNDLTDLKRGFDGFKNVLEVYKLRKIVGTTKGGVEIV